jgi:hypothetical protein
MERGVEIFDCGSDEGVRLYCTIKSLLPHPFNSIQFENSASPLHMKRGKKIFDYRSDEGVRLYCTIKSLLPHPFNSIQFENSASLSTWRGARKCSIVGVMKG